MAIGRIKILGLRLDSSANPVYFLKKQDKWPELALPFSWYQSVARFWVKSQIGENEAFSSVEGLEKIFMKLSIEEKTKQTKITKMLAINKQSDENITVEII